MKGRSVRKLRCVTVNLHGAVVGLGLGHHQQVVCGLDLKILLVTVVLESGIHRSKYRGFFSRLHVYGEASTETCFLHLITRKHLLLCTVFGRIRTFSTHLTFLYAPLLCFVYIQIHLKKKKNYYQNEINQTSLFRVMKYHCPWTNNIANIKSLI